MRKIGILVDGSLKVSEPLNELAETIKQIRSFTQSARQPYILYEALWSMPESQENQGVLLCADDKARPANIKNVVWRELTSLLQHRDSANILYGIEQLDQMSGRGEEAGLSGYDTTFDFDCRPVIDAIHGLIADSDSKVALSEEEIFNQSICFRK